ncbi:hypothetical protein HDU89_008918 [Geranomyces variabilis]|nr:hypothetical protein HDU89_008918 [Geranomyces variabilis]
MSVPASTLTNHLQRTVPNIALSTDDAATLYALIDARPDLSQARKDPTGQNSNVFSVSVPPSDDSSTRALRTYVFKQPTNAASAQALDHESSNLGLIRAASTTFPFAVPEFLGTAGGLRVMTLLPGVNGVRALAACGSTEERMQLVHAFGAVLAALHACEVRGAAMVWFQSEGALAHPGRAGSRDWFARVMHRVAPAVRAAIPAIGDEAYRARTQRRLDLCLAVLDRLDTDPVWTAAPFSRLHFCHGDYMLANVMFEKTAQGGGWRCSGVLDLGDAGYGDARSDLMIGTECLEFQNISREEIAGCQSAFLSGYGMPDFDRAAAEPWDACYLLKDFAA